jgi:hypothetical protein
MRATCVKERNRRFESGPLRHRARLCEFYARSGLHKQDARVGALLAQQHLGRSRQCNAHCRRDRSLSKHRATARRSHRISGNAMKITLTAGGRFQTASSFLPALLAVYASSRVCSGIFGFSGGYFAVSRAWPLFSPLVACNIENDSKVCYQSACLEQLSDCRGPKLRNCVRECARGCFAPVTCGGRG